VSRTADVPYYQQREDEVDAKLYNLWRRAKHRFTMPMRIPLEGYKGLIMILENDEWVCADENLNDMPVIAWLEFEDDHRETLHMPVKCKLNYYHYAASKVRAHSLELAQIELDKRLHKN